ncbi:MAG: NUDIX hydrolase [Acidobacteria bacterium]|nr:MAG: NUDIX hydrolase [Acidobacteriota bacterium]RPJ85882.1 MAG: NUDIX hydrolase [Acidobacteriota bacterium]
MQVERKLVYSGRIVDLIVDTIEVNGREAIREVVKHPGGVVILVETEDGRIPFVRQTRYPLGKLLLELPAGKLDPGEEPSHSAARELEEETGIRPEHLNHVYSFYPSPGFCTELLHLYHTDSFKRTASKFDHDEDIVVEYYSLEDALEMCRQGAIVDGKTILALHWLYFQRQSR